MHAHIYTAIYTYKYVYTYNWYMKHNVIISIRASLLYENTPCRRIIKKGDETHCSNCSIREREDILDQ